MPLTEADRIDWDDLRLCLAVARAGTLSAAGEALGLSHSTLLRRISAFEKRLGVTLFTRNSHGYAPNAAGQKFVAAAALVEAQISGAVAETHGRDEAMAGVIRFAVPDLSGQALMHIVRGFAESHPAIEIIFDVSQKPTGMTLGDAHVALALTAEPPAGQIGNPVGPVGFAAYADVRLIERLPSDARAHLSWVGLSPSLNHLPVGRFDNELSHGCARRHVCNTVPMHYAAIRQGLGAGVLACSIGDADKRLVRCSPVFSDDCLTLWLMHRKELRGNARIMAFYRHLLQQLKRGRGLIQGDQPFRDPILLIGTG